MAKTRLTGVGELPSFGVLHGVAPSYRRDTFAADLDRDRVGNLSPKPTSLGNTALNDPFDFNISCGPNPAFSLVSQLYGCQKILGCRPTHQFGPQDCHARRGRCVAPTVAIKSRRCFACIPTRIGILPETPSSKYLARTALLLQSNPTCRSRMTHGWTLAARKSTNHTSQLPAFLFSAIRGSRDRSLDIKNNKDITRATIHTLRK